MVAKAPKPQEFKGPKKPLTGYFLFQNAHRDSVGAAVRAECDKTGEPFKIMMLASKFSELWKNAPPAEIEGYHKKAVADKKDYEEALAAWKLSDDYQQYVKADALFRKKTADKKARNACLAAGMPKKPTTTFIQFSQDVMVECTEKLKAAGKPATMQNRAPLVKELWAALTPEKKAKYDQQAKERKEQYDKDMAEFRNTDEFKAYSKAQDKNKKNQQKKLSDGKGERPSKRRKVDETATEVPEGSGDVEETESAEAETA